ncbi:MAG: hydantoinase/oxoprolinase N-terminal domain-containing protein, partial [Alphaproteobacteria bacterium]
MSELWIGIDTGGTFTDVVALDPATGKEWSVKEPTTPEDPSIGILRGLDRCLLKVKSKTGDIALLVHGTTLATNAILQGNWAKAGMITTAGFSDILDLARQRRPNFFNLDVPKPLPPIPTHLRYEVAERLEPDGSIEIPLDVDAVARAALALREKGAESIVIAFLHAYANSAHEALAEKAVRKVWPQSFVTKSAELTPEFREYERFATASINACLTPILTRYLELFEEGLIKQGVSAPLQVMQSNGGAASATTVRNRPIDTFFSGPAGGVIGAAELVASESRNTLVTFDMGGTSTDVCLVREGTPGYTSQREMAGFP